MVFSVRSFVNKHAQGQEGKDGRDLIEHLLVRNPQKRYGCSGALMREMKSHEVRARARGPTHARAPTRTLTII
jgi:serine/threonine protein kinase